MTMVQVKAQDAATSTPATTNPGGFIIKGGVNFSNISTKNDGSYNDANSLTTFNVGVLADLALMSNLSVQSGVVLTGKGSKASGSLLGVSNTTKFNPLYIEVPINLVAKIPLGGTSNVFLGAGPYGAIGVGGKWKNNTTVGGVESSSDENIKFGNDNGDDLKSFDFGFNGLAGVEISRVLIGVNYGLGLSKIFPNSGDNNSNDKNKYRVLSVNVGVRL